MDVQSPGKNESCHRKGGAFQGITTRRYLTVCFFAISTTLSTRCV